MTTFSSDKTIQRRYDRTVYKLSPVWLEEKTKRVRAILLAVFVPCVLAALVLIFDKEETGFALVQSVMIAVLLPCVIFAPLAILRYKNDRIASLPAGAGRYGDTLAFDENRMIYTYRNRLEAPPRRQHEHTVYYELVQRAVVYRRLQTLMVLAGGVDTDYNASGMVHRRRKYDTHDDGTPAARWVDIPLTYTDNNAFLQAFAQVTGITPEVSDACITDEDLPGTPQDE